jgi:hypothetical protein
MAQMLATTYSERDVSDVESYVRDAIGGVSGPMGWDEREQLVARGILLVRRIAQALPPEASLDAVLRDRLAPALNAYRWRVGRPLPTHLTHPGLASVRRAA